MTDKVWVLEYGSKISFDMHPVQHVIISRPPKQEIASSPCIYIIMFVTLIFVIGLIKIYSWRPFLRNPFKIHLFVQNDFFIIKT